jgi:hypothetical protein
MNQTEPNESEGVMAGLVPAIHVFAYSAIKKDVDARERKRVYARLSPRYARA